jgi:hypothetical protein
MDNKKADILSPGKPPYFYDQLEKGTFLTIEQLEDIVGLQRADNPDKFQYALLGLQSDIHEKTDVTCVLRSDGMDILTDQQASRYNHGEFHRHLRASARRHQKNLEVDAGNLSPEQRIEHDRNLLRNGRILAAVQTEQRKIRLEGNKPAQIEAPKRKRGRPRKIPLVELNPPSVN